MGLILGGGEGDGDRRLAFLAARFSVFEISRARLWFEGGGGDVDRRSGEGDLEAGDSGLSDLRRKESPASCG